MKKIQYQIERAYIDLAKPVAGRYAVIIFSWDVVNKALEVDGTMRKSACLIQCT